MNRRILFYTPIFPPQYSGATFQAIALAKQLRKLGHSVTFLCLRDSAEHRPLREWDATVHEGFEVIELPIRNYQEPFTMVQHAELVLRLSIILFSLRARFDVIHSHCFQFPIAAIGVVGRLIRKKTCCKVTMSTDLDYERIGRVTGYLYGWLPRAFNRVIAISSEIAAAVRDKGFRKDAIMSIPNGVDTDRFHPVSQDVKRGIRKSLGYGVQPIVVFVGSITYRKGVDDLMKIWKEVTAHSPDAMLLLLGPRCHAEGATGDAYCYDEAVDFVREHRMEDRVRFLGRVDDVRPYLQSADLLALPSKLEGMPNVVLEAMACGTPCVVNRVSGVADIVTPGENGEIIDFDKGQFSRVIVELLESPGKRDAYGKRAGATIQARFSLQSVADRYARLYAALQH